MTEDCCRFSLRKSLEDTSRRLQEDGSLAPREVQEERLEICKSCPHLKALNRCEICGCFMNLKVKFANMRCPLPEPNWIEYHD